MLLPPDAQLTRGPLTSHVSLLAANRLTQTGTKYLWSAGFLLVQMLATIFQESDQAFSIQPACEQASFLFNVEYNSIISQYRGPPMSPSLEWEPQGFKY